MTYPISKIDGLTPLAAKELKAQGIRTTDALLERTKSPKGRKALAKATKISEQLLLEWANVADYMRVPGMGNARAGLFRAAGAKTLREFTYRNPERLAMAAKEINNERKFVRVLPSTESVATLIDRARKLDFKIKY